jgi:hypothetical protein
MSFSTWRGGLWGAGLWNPARLQWAPTLTSHDPNPPITLENAAGGGGVSGTLSQTLGALIAAGTAGVAVSGSAGLTLGALTLTATATVAVSGTGAATLGVLTEVGTGAVAVGGSLARTLGTLTALGSGGISVSGSLAQTLGALSLSASGTTGGGSGPTTVRRYYHGSPRVAGAVRLSKRFYYVDEAA